jgi:type IV pilus assembly protein PilB
MRIEPQQLKAFLLDAKLVNEDQFEKAKKAAEKNNQKIGDVLVSEGLITQEKLLKLEAYILGIPFIDLEK